jgi:diaminohydroxyphosphoribosylaminopyrimidine deaminase/5-amino-6-(5-phosphoribosylamino)uracil reductase
MPAAWTRSEHSSPRIIGGTGPGAVAGEGVTLVTQAIRLRDVEVSRAADDLLVRGYTGP